MAVEGGVGGRGGGAGRRPDCEWDEEVLRMVFLCATQQHTPAKRATASSTLTEDEAANACMARK